MEVPANLRFLDMTMVMMASDIQTSLLVECNVLWANRRAS
jgi:hypothetical protein